jgi:DNA polymerase-3 subunit epsilon
MDMIIEIDGEVKETFDLKVQPFPNQIVTPESLEINNITMDMLKTYPKPKDVHKEFSELLCTYVDRYDKSDKFFMVGYNSAGFDDQFLRTWFKNAGDNYYGSMIWWPTIDVAILVMDAIKEQRNKFINFQLPTVAKMLGIEVDESKLHDALYDVYLTRELYQKITG